MKCKDIRQGHIINCGRFDDTKIGRNLGIGLIVLECQDPDAITNESKTNRASLGRLVKTIQSTNGTNVVGIAHDGRDTELVGQDGRTRAQTCKPEALVLRKGSVFATNNELVVTKHAHNGSLRALTIGKRNVASTLLVIDGTVGIASLNCVGSHISTLERNFDTWIKIGRTLLDSRDVRIATGIVHARCTLAIGQNDNGLAVVARRAKGSTGAHLFIGQEFHGKRAHGRSSRSRSSGTH